MIDFMDKGDIETIKPLVKEDVIDSRKIEELNDYLEYKFKEDAIKKHIENFKKIPFGKFYVILNSQNVKGLTSISYTDFEQFYYGKIIKSKDIYSNNSFQYKDLKNENENSFSIKNLKYLNENVEEAKVIRREGETENNSISNNVLNSDFLKFFSYIFSKPEYIRNIRGIIKVKLNNSITSDIIKDIEIIKASGRKETIKEIYYDNNKDVIIILENLDENISKIKMTNYFDGIIKVKSILNIHGSSKTVKMIKANIEKLFIIPFFKIIEIISISKFRNKGENNYENLKEQYFGKDFKNITILDPFKKAN
jgi:hypothetical protein